MGYRDPSVFPAADNGDVLWRMFESGDDLSKRREVDFWTVFPSEDRALAFGLHFLEAGEKVSMSRTGQPATESTES